MSTTARSDRPIRRWISCVRPEGAPFTTSRGERVLVARGSMPYSAVTQPSPLPLRKGGTLSSKLAAHTTRVSPTSTRHEPSACFRNPVVSWTGRSCVAAAAVGARARLAREHLGVDLRAEVAQAEAHGFAAFDHRGRRRAREAVEPAVLLAVREHDHHVVASLGERDRLDEVLRRLLAARARPGVDAVRARVVGGEHLLDGARVALAHLAQVVRPEVDAGDGVVERCALVADALGAGDRASGRGHHLHQAARPGPAERARVVARLLQDQRGDERGIEARPRAPPRPAPGRSGSGTAPATPRAAGGRPPRPPTRGRRASSR